MRYVDLTGRVFGRLTVVRRAENDASLAELELIVAAMKKIVVDGNVKL